MVRILAASFLHHAIETLNSEQRKVPKKSSIPALSLNIHAKNPKKSSSEFD